MKTITFYSYKGGVGRSLALANVAFELAEGLKKPRSVFALDLDMEAPGLHYKFFKTPEERAPITCGFVDFAASYFENDRTFPDWRDHVLKVPTKSGSIHLMPAGNSLSNAYWNRYFGTRWPERFSDRAHAPEFFLALQQRIKVDYAPDYLLLDARTGITEVGSAALAMLSSSIVVVFANNDESKEGTREVLQGIARTLEDFPAPTIIPVLSRVPKGMMNDDDDRKKLKEYLNIPSTDGTKTPPMVDVIVLHSDPELEKREFVVLGAQSERRDTPLGCDYLDILVALGMNAEDEAVLVARTLEGEAADEAKQGDTKTALETAREALEQRKALDGADHPAYLRQLEDYADLLVRDGQIDAAIEHWRMLEASPNTPDPETRGRFAERIVLACADKGPFELVQDRIGTAVDNLVTAKGPMAATEFLGQVRSRYQIGEGIRHPSYADVLRQSWRFLFAMDDPEYREKMRNLVDDAIRHFAVDRDEGRIPWAEAQWARAQLLVASKAFGEAELALRRAIATFELGKEDARAEDARRALDDVLRELRRDEEVQWAAQRTRKQEKPMRPPPPTKTPPPMHRMMRSSSEFVTMPVALTVVTPILGGAARTREIDAVDTIRVPSLRGALRFWWRALYGANFSSEELYVAESNLFGRAADDGGGRSAVDVRISKCTPGEHDESDIRLYGQTATTGAYALWPARETRSRDNPQPTAPRRAPGTHFQLHIRCPKEKEAQIRNAVRALILFGGYGGRTRRGTGSFTVTRVQDSSEWLPAAATREALTKLFGEDIFAKLPNHAPSDLPVLRGADLRVGKPMNHAEEAWIHALHWLRDFRQDDGSGARQKGSDNSRPGRSNWPEADKVRHAAKTWADEHPPRHNDTPAWPRAGFGLPILGQFQQLERGRGKIRYRKPEPDPFKLYWYDKDDKEHDRLASPLIVKALPLANGQFAPCALWLHRGYPAGGEVGLRLKDVPKPLAKAEFDMLVSPGDKALFRPLDTNPSVAKGMALRSAFLTWLVQSKKTQVVAP